jgi:hypothetical protein
VKKEVRHRGVNVGRALVHLHRTKVVRLVLVVARGLFAFSLRQLLLTLG